MKLKYYLRGLGIGMVVTALILGISDSHRQEQAAQTMTDDQIKERAAQLGMVDSSELTLAELQNSIKQPTQSSPADADTDSKETQEQDSTEVETETADATEASETQTTEALVTTAEPTAEPEVTSTPEVTKEPDRTAAPEATKEPEVTVAPETTTAPEQTAAPEIIEETAAPEAAAEPEQAASEQPRTVSITIMKGDTSGSVSRQLQEKGLVESAQTFDNYLCNNGYSRSINPGIYEIAPGTSREEIAKIITGKH